VNERARAAREAAVSRVAADRVAVGHDNERVAGIGTDPAADVVREVLSRTVRTTTPFVLFAFTASELLLILLLLRVTAAAPPRPAALTAAGTTSPRRRDFLGALYEKSRAARSLKERSIYRGPLLSKPTYVEGLDLLRQDFTIKNAKTFVGTVMEGMPYDPKELLYIVEWRQGEGEFESLRGKLREELGGFLSLAPAPPKAA
jgi:hypothetical protein